MIKAMKISRTVGAFALMGMGVLYFSIGCASVQIGLASMERFIVGGFAVACVGLLMLLTAE